MKDAEQALAPDAKGRAGEARSLGSKVKNMSKEEKEKIKQFMRLVLYQMHPNLNEYPLQQMETAENSQGEGFEGTSFEESDYLKQAYYMKQVIDTL